MKQYYPLFLLRDEDFEDLIIDICKEILGISTIKFSIGKDGGRDGRFEGTAKNCPNDKEPWSGKFIIQAKHTQNQIASCSNPDFKKQIIIKKEIPKLKKLKLINEVDNYLLFTNRKLTGNQDSKLRKIISDETKIKNIIIYGVETINSLLFDNPKIIDKHGLNNFDEPLRFYEEDMKEIISNFYEYLSIIPINEIGRISNFKYINKTEKNKKNKLSKECFDMIKRDYLLYFNQISDFLKDPRNKKIKIAYENTTSELKSIIIEKRENYDKFDQIINYIYKYILEKNKKMLWNKRKLIFTFLYYMYFNCDIGIE